MMTHRFATATMFTVVFGYPTDWYLRKRAKRDLYAPVVTKINLGSRPHLSVKNLVPRPELAATLKELFLSEDEREQEDSTCFGAIIGPTGTGKTLAVKDLCNRYPEGVLYHEVELSKCFVEALAKDVGMKIKPDSVLDLLLEHVSKNYVHYHHLPQGTHEGVKLVMDTLRVAAVKYKEQTGRVPVLFLDRADILAKRDEAVFAELLVCAKVLANDNTLSIVFVSSDGSVLPLMKDSSENNRSNKIEEVLDISDEKALNYLIQGGVLERVAKKIVEMVGGRFAYLRRSTRLVRYYNKARPDLTDEDMLNRIEEDMLALVLEKQREAIALMQPYSSTLIKKISEVDQVAPSSFLKEMKTKEERLKAANCIRKMLSANILRYNAKGMLTWHGAIPRRAFITRH